jgi:hypothetical protein
VTTVSDRIIALLAPAGEQVYNFGARGLETWSRCHAARPLVTTWITAVAWILLVAIVIGGAGMWAEHGRRTS